MARRESRVPEVSLGRPVQLRSQAPKDLPERRRGQEPVRAPAEACGSPRRVGRRKESRTTPEVIRCGDVRSAQGGGTLQAPRATVRRHPTTKREGPASASLESVSINLDEAAEALRAVGRHTCPSRMARPPRQPAAGHPYRSPRSLSNRRIDTDCLITILLCLHRRWWFFA
jgi:hypothetical protein